MLDALQGAPEWRAARCGKITASGVGDVMAKGRGGAPSASRANYIARLVVERLTGEPAETYSSAAMERGVEVESEAREAYAFHSGVEVVQSGFVPHPTIAWAGASPDGLVGMDGLVEIKCPNMSTHLDTLRGGAVPRCYVLQMQWQMACTRRVWCDYVSYDPRFPLHLRLYVRRVARDDGLIAEITGAVEPALAEVDAAVNELMLQEAA
jgi:putative phage-type endonuclease